MHQHNLAEACRRTAVKEDTLSRPRLMVPCIVIFSIGSSASPSVGTKGQVGAGFVLPDHGESTILFLVASLQC